MFFVKMFQIPQMFLPETFQIPQMFYIFLAALFYSFNELDNKIQQNQVESLLMRSFL